MRFKWPYLAPALPLTFIPPHTTPMSRTAPQTTLTHDLHQPSRPNSHVPTKAMLWYDAIVDDMLSHPGTTLKATAERLGRSPVTIGYIVNSDLFKARYAQRRDQFNEELDTRLIGKLAKVAELSLDLTLESLEKKRTAVPLPLLHEVSDKALARLGYGPKQDGPSTQVAVTVNAPQVAAPVSAEALQQARQTLRTIEASRSDPRPVQSPQSLLPQPEVEVFEPAPQGSVVAGAKEEA